MSEITPSEEEIQRSVERNFDNLLSTSPRISEIFQKDVGDTVTAPISFVAKHKRLTELTDEAAALVYPISACRKGCSHCCNMALTISSYEASLIGTAIGIFPVAAENCDDRGMMVEKYMNVPCPFLVGNACGIYEHRPIACKTHFNISDYPQLCDIVNHPGQDVANVNFGPIWMADMIISLNDCTFNDIRAYFPMLD